ncbi:MAG: shikimate kinase [Ruminococcus sp.]|nr:shikimate kinase [Ruminococcus sp.]
MTLFLCGFMGCGKSALGRALSKRLELPLIDTDEYIVKTQGMSIPEIFEKYGEPYFREVEAKAIADLSQQEAVISCGGGAILNDKTAKIARENGIVILLDQSFDVCYSRIKDDKNRPLVQKNTKEQLREIYNARDSVYRKNSTIVVKAGNTPEESAERVINAIQ